MNPGDSNFHRPVMVEQIVEGLVTDRGGAYLDVTVGGGGHSRAILEALAGTGHLIGLDRDSEALREAAVLADDFPGQVTLLHGSFGNLAHQLALAVDALTGRELCGVLFDLGVSSHQIDEADRGFSYKQDGPLDMRMDRSAGVPVAKIIAQVSEADLAGIIRQFGEERGARRIARSICRQRDRHGMETTSDLRRAVVETGPSHPAKTLARVFQSLRIHANEELAQLRSGLNAAIEALPVGGRLAVISYHSLEDRLVKTRLAEFMRGCKCPPRLPVCVCGNRPQFKAMHRKPLRAGPEEVDANSRARSAILRVSERVAE